MLSPPFPHLSIHLPPNKDHNHHRHPPEDSVHKPSPEPAPHAPAHNTSHDEPDDGAGSHELLAALEGGDGAARALRGRQDLVALLERLGEVRLDGVLVVEGPRGHGGGKHGVHAHARQVRPRRGVQVHLLRQRVAESAHRGLGRRVRREACEAVE